MKLQVSCKQTVEGNEKLWNETLFVKYNKAPIQQNPVAFQNKWMQDYYNERTPAHIIADLVHLKSVNPEGRFEEVAAEKYNKPTEKDSSDGNIDVDVSLEPDLDDILTLPSPVRYVKHYLQLCPASIIDMLFDHIQPHQQGTTMSPHIAFMLGVVYDAGIRVEVNHSSALAMYNKAKKGKYLYAYYTLFDIYSRSYATYGLACDQSKALRQIVKMAMYCIYSANSWMGSKIAGDGIPAFLSMAYIHMDLYEYTCDYVRNIMARDKNDSLSKARKQILQLLIAIDKKEIEEAFAKLETLADSDPHLLTLLKVVDAYLSGIGGAAKNVDKAKALLTKAVELKSDSYWTLCAEEILAYQLDLKGEFALAQEYYLKTMQHGFAYSLKRMGIAYAVGLHVERNVELALKCVQTAAAYGCTDASLVWLEMCVYLKELWPVAQKCLAELSPVVPLMTQFEQDCYQLYKGIMLEKGIGRPIDYPNAITIYFALPKRDFPVTLYRLGKIYEKKHNFMQAQQYYEDCFHNYMDIVKTWTLPHASTYIRLAKLALKGKGCEQNLHRAKEYFEKSLSMKCCATIPCLMRKSRASVRLTVLQATLAASQV